MTNDHASIDAPGEAIEPAGTGRANSVTGPLSGFKVLDLTRALAGPYCTALLGDLGADVIKVEGLPKGDATRHWPPFDGARSLYYLSTNRNKRSVALDLRAREAQQVLADLAAEADVLVENFRPGVLARLGLDRDRLRKERPELVIASVSGFGEVGPMRDDAGLDQVAQGMSGLMSVTGAGDHTPMRAGVPIVDMTAGLYSTIGILASLVARGRGHAPRVNTSLLESAVALMTFQAQRYLSAGEVPVPQGNDHPLISPYGTFRAADANINVAVGTEAQWVALCEVLEGRYLLERPEYDCPSKRSANRDALYAELNDLFGKRPAREWLDELRKRGVPCGPIYTMDQVFDDAQVQALGLVQAVPRNGDGVTRLVRGPVWVDGEPPAIWGHPPLLGEHSREILAELGYDNRRIDNLIARGAVGQA
jgi:crotonobetainyl-CoA:carnitine CoA-transferase CaiB-like acyl-CoA transferase